MHRFSFLFRYFPSALSPCAFCTKKRAIEDATTGPSKSADGSQYYCCICQKKMEKTAVGHCHTPSNPKLLAYVSPHALYVYFSCFSLSPALIQSSFFNVISVKLLPFGKIRSLAGASGCCKHRTLPQPQQQKPFLNLQGQSKDYFRGQSFQETQEKLDSQMEKVVLRQLRINKRVIT